MRFSPCAPWPIRARRLAWQQCRQTGFSAAGRSRIPCAMLFADHRWMCVALLRLGSSVVRDRRCSGRSIGMDMHVWQKALGSYRMGQEHGDRQKRNDVRKLLPD